MLVQVTAVQSANVGVTSRVTVRSLSKDESASVIAKFSLTNATYNFCFDDCSVILPLK